MLLKQLLSRARIVLDAKVSLKPTVGIKGSWMRREEERGQETRPAWLAAHGTGRQCGQLEALNLQDSRRVSLSLLPHCTRGLSCRSIPVGSNPVPAGRF